MACYAQHAYNILQSKEISHRFSSVNSFSLYLFQTSGDMSQYVSIRLNRHDLKLEAAGLKVWIQSTVVAKLAQRYLNRC